jgi:hypothetical protein
VIVRFNAANRTLTPKDKKLRELALYISEKSCGDEAFGATKLNKLLFYADFLAYLNFDESITGQDYFRLPNGPAPRRWVPVREHMVEAGEIKVMDAEFHGFPQKRPVPLRPAKLEGFTTEQIALVDKIIALHRGKTASEISEQSHGFVGWALAGDKETIPYQVARVSRRSLTEREIKHGQNLESQAAAILMQKAA